jgi:hypothetical protein
MKVSHLSIIPIQMPADPRADMYSTLCYVHADTTQIAKTLKPVRTYGPSGGGVYYRMSFDIILSFGLTEFKAQIGWTEDVSRTICASEFHLLNTGNLGRREEVRRRFSFFWA